jgi:choline kinase
LSRSVTTIKKKTLENDISVVILSAGIGARIKSAEPRSLLKLGKRTLLEHQVNAIKRTFKECEIIGVFGAHIDKVIKKTGNNIRIVENQLFNETNNSESLRLGINNTINNNVLFVHGDIYFTEKIFKNANFKKSFIVVDANNDISDKEVGVTLNKNKTTILSYGLQKKWCQMCFLTGKELKLMKSLLLKMDQNDKKMLSFELINKIIDCGGSFEAHEEEGAHVVEIDCIKDTKNENINLQ